MAFRSLRLRRALSLSSSILNHSLHPQLPIPSTSRYPRSISTPPTLFFPQVRRPFTSTATLFRKPFDPDTDEIGPDTILFEGCDYNHWLITVDFPKDSNLSREQMIETYVNIASQVFGSVEEAKKKIYALSTTTYQGFQVECSEETSEKFKSISQVVFVLPDSYIDPVNKEYGGDKYVNGEIFPRPPPVHYVRRNRDRGPREPMPFNREGNAPHGNNYGPPPQQNYGPASQQSYGRAPPQQNYGPPSQQSYGQPSTQQNFGPPSQQSYGQPPAQQNYGPSSQQSYGQPSPHQNYGPGSQQSYGPPSWQSYGQRPSQQNYGPPPQQNYRPPPPQCPDHRGAPPQHQSSGNSSNMPANRAAGPQSSDQRGFPQDANHGFERNN